MFLRHGLLEPRAVGFIAREFIRYSEPHLV